MKIPKIKDIKEFSAHIIFDHAGAHTKSYAFSSIKIALFIGLYTFVIALTVFLFLLATPAKFLLISDEEALRGESMRLLQLSKRVIYLSKELNHIQSLNKSLKNAVFMGDSDLAKSIREKQEIQKQQKTENPFGGYIFGAVKALFMDQENNSVRVVYFINPVNSQFTSRGFSAEKGHMGIDFPLRSGQPVFAVAFGTVVFADYTSDDGYMIILMHQDNYITVYKHCSVLVKKIRDKVAQGEVIALSGNSGLNTTGPHLHFEVWMDGQAVDPKSVLLK
ncbi:MAG: M23 family metallopeptidase [Ignavibacteria bacterium]